jgi:alkyl hydroperoxide reductase subunit F
MLDDSLKEQIKELFKSVENNIELIFDDCEHTNQNELVGLLEEVASLNPKIKTRKSGKTRAIPHFSIAVNQKITGIEFSGIPGGHEFSSLVLAILNADGKGKLPDAGISARIRRLKGPIRVKTYISLTCENCPDVVQALNQLALIHPDFHHEMVDGGYVQDEIQALGIQGVPSVVVDSKLIHSGKIGQLDLLTLLEREFGQNQQIGQATDLGHYDVTVIGGGPAGAAAAIYSVRKGLKTILLAEKIGGQVQETKGIENFISIPYTEGPELTAHLYSHLKSYPIEILEQRRVTKVGTDKVKKIELEGGEFLNTDSVIVATGARWRELGIQGEKEYIGRGVAFCPHCDGPFYKGKKVAVIGGGNSGVEAAIDLAGITSEVVLFEFQSQLKADQVLVNKLNSLPNVRTITGAKTKTIIGNGTKVTHLKFEHVATNEMEEIEIDGIFVQIGLLPNSQFLKGTVDLSNFGEVIIDPKGRTTAPGIYAAGDVTTIPFKQIIIAMGEGAKAALTMFEDRIRSEK